MDAFSTLAQSDKTLKKSKQNCVQSECEHMRSHHIRYHNKNETSPCSEKAKAEICGFAELLKKCH